MDRPKVETAERATFTPGPTCEHQPLEYFDASANRWVSYGECEDCLSDHCEPNGDPCRCAIHSYRRATRAALSKADGAVTGEADPIDEYHAEDGR